MVLVRTKHVYKSLEGVNTNVNERESVGITYINL